MAAYPCDAFIYPLNMNLEFLMMSENDQNNVNRKRWIKTAYIQYELKHVK